jgi:hypothetical protein
VLHLEHSIVLCWKLDTSEGRLEIPRNCSNVVVEKDGEDQLHRSYEKRGSITVMPDMLRTLMYSASWGFGSGSGLYSANPRFVFGPVFRPWQRKVFLPRRPLRLLTGVCSAEFLRGSGAERTLCVWREAEASRIHLRRKREWFAGFEFFVFCVGTWPGSIPLPSVA